MSDVPPRRITQVEPAGRWRGPAMDTVVLAYDDRHRRRVVLTCISGQRVLLDLAEATVLRHGDGLVTESGGVVAVEAAPEALLEIAARDAHHLVRVAWHLGNRHLPTQILEGRLRIREDHVIEDMVRGLGAEVRRIEAPFDPEGGAYGHGAVHGHDHGRDHGHGQRHHHSHHHDHHHHAEAHEHD